MVVFTIVERMPQPSHHLIGIFCIQFAFFDRLKLNVIIINT